MTLIRDLCGQHTSVASKATSAARSSFSQNAKVSRSYHQALVRYGPRHGHGFLDATNVPLFSGFAGTMRL